MAASEKCFLAVDLGASSGRLVAGLYGNDRLRLEDAYRFENGGIVAGERMYWDLLALWKHMLNGMRSCGTTYGNHIASIGIDTWGVDFGLLDHNDELLGNPFHYRDSRKTGILERAFEIVPRDEIFAKTGLQFMEFNSLYQLLVMKQEASPLLEAAHSLLMIPDLFNWLLTGEKVNEKTDASTSQFYNPQTDAWATSLFDRFELPQRILGNLVDAGTRLGPLRESVQTDTGLPGIDVVLPGTHDTASAVVSVPAEGSASNQPDWCYISSGTWSLMGVEVASPIVNDNCLRLNFTNEGGVGGTTRLLKNIGGLWLVQECRRIWNQQGKDFDWGELVRLAESNPPLASHIDPDHQDLVAPADMPASIRAFCSRTGQTVPENEGAVIRCALESLALRYRQVLGWLEELINGRISTIHIVGGGTQNRLLCQMTADCCNRRVVAGPVEATAIGNVMMQAMAAGEVASLDEARAVVRRSFEVEEYSPIDPAPWDEAFQKFSQVITK